MEQTQELLQKWDVRARRPRMEISGEGLMLGAGTVLAGMAREGRGRPRLALDDEPRVMALLATAYERPVEVRLLAKLRRAAELWNDGEKALAHIHLAHTGLPPCGPDQALRLFVAAELIEAGVTPETLMKAQGFDPAPLAMLKFNPAQPRWPAGTGRDSGRWSGGASVDTAGVKDFVARLLLEAARRAARALRPSEPEPPNPEVVNPETKPPEPPEAEDLQLPKVDANKLHHIFDNPRHGLDGLVTECGSQESAFQAVARATREAVKAQGITGEYEIEVKVGRHLLTVTGHVDNGIVNIGTVYIPWTR
jgi:hypothetical protein